MATLDDKQEVDSEYYGFSKGAQEVRESHWGMTIRFRSIIDVSKATALGSGAGFVHEGKGQFFAAYCVVIDPFLSQVDPCAFASDETVQQLLKEMEDSFTARFGRSLVVTSFISVLTIHA